VSDLKGTLQSLREKQAERERLLEGLKMWSAAKLMGYGPDDVRTFGVIPPEHQHEAKRRGQPLRVAILHNGEQIPLDDALAEVGGR
jgi:hypothetical protein